MRGCGRNHRAKLTGGQIARVLADHVGLPGTIAAIRAIAKVKTSCGARRAGAQMNRERVAARERDVDLGYVR